MTKHLVKASSTDNSNINMATNEKPSSSNESNLEAKNSQDVKTKAFENSNASFGIYTPAYRKKQVPLQKPVKYKILHNPRENLGLYLNNTQVELSSLQDMLNNLNSMELTNFCNLIEEAEMENSKEARPDLVNICQEIDDEQRLSDNDNLVDSDEYVKSSFAEELADLPMEPTTTNETNLDSGEYSATLQIPSDLQSGQYSDGNLNDIESDVLPDEYFTI
ncbi:uncharacterized protein LOC108906181 isoform X2 [Anoplophora glabripennis]|nr:uncharacterized protein LOC108906181 isoform X2 [Anoplophora glabripennis]